MKKHEIRFSNAGKLRRIGTLIELIFMIFHDFIIHNWVQVSSIVFSKGVY